jgi:tetratricopeptide (TPR) repeat protein
MVKAWKEKVVIPTYEAGKPEKNPVFLEKRVYQGSSGVVYPYPVIESISREKVDKEYLAVFLENEYIKVMILPELGGRVQMAYDKIKQRHFIYYNRVIKPALVGLAGPWISGGIEFNWPQHHRPSTFLPVDFKIEENPDGSVTVWTNEMERMFHQKGMAGFTLRPGCAYLEIKGVVFNRTEIPQTFLWWANPAVHVNVAYQSVFPPDIHAVFDHGKRAVSTFPIATGTYYKVDYSAGVDISNYKNIPVPTSYMAVGSRFNFEGGYENDTKGGMLHVANHHVSPGKKQWTWGNGDFGRAWDRNLTDEDGPYIELMAGVYTENQPDFSWLQPYEEKSFVQYFMPYREIGIVKNASRDFLLNVEDENGWVRIKVFATSSQKVRIILKDGSGTVLFEKEAVLSPEVFFDETAPTDGVAFDYLRLEIVSKGKVALSWQAEKDEIVPAPDPAEAALLPEEIKTTEQLYLTGLHLEQYRHATWNPVDYYEEALRRDPDDVRNNNALGLWYIRKGRFDLAEGYLRTAVKVLQRRNPNPYDGEPLYNLGLSLKYQGKLDEAYGMFYKSTWNGAWQDAGYFACAQISVLQERLEDALDEIDHSLIRNWHNHKARALKAAILRKLGRKEEALKWIEESLEIDLFNYGCMFERHLLTGESLEAMDSLMHGSPFNYEELAVDYTWAGLWKEAVAVLDHAGKVGAANPMTSYFKAWAMVNGGIPGSRKAYAEAASADPTLCFPNRLEAVPALEKAIEKNPKDARAPYYLGNLYYDKRQYDLALILWENSARLDPSFPTVWRNLALVWFNKMGDQDGALDCMEKAFSLDPSDSRVLMELDQLYKRLKKPNAERLAFLEKYPDLVQERDDLLLEYITLLNGTGRYSEAKDLIDRHTFHPWEGGEGKVPAQYQFARTEMAKVLIAKGRFEEAGKLLEECLVYPHNLGEGKLIGAQDNDFYYFLGCVHEELGNADKAKECWEKASLGPQEPAPAMYYNDSKPEKIFYQGMALRKLGRGQEALSRFNKLVSYGEKHIFDKVVMDYFAVSLPDLLIWEDSLDTKNKIHCKLMLALGHFGLGNMEKAGKFLSEVKEEDPCHQGIMALESLMALF